MVVEKKISVTLSSKEREGLREAVEILDTLCYEIGDNCDQCPLYDICQRYDKPCDIVLNIIDTLDESH